MHKTIDRSSAPPTDLASVVRSFAEDYPGHEVRAFLRALADGDAAAAQPDPEVPCSTD